MKRGNFPGRKQIKQQEAIARNEAYQKLSHEEKLQKADNTPAASVVDSPDNYTSSLKQRAKLAGIKNG